MKIVYAKFNSIEGYTDICPGMYILQARNIKTAKGKIGWKKIRDGINFIPNNFVAFSSKKEAIENVKKWAKRTPKNSGTVYVEYVEQKKPIENPAFSYKYELTMYWSKVDLDPTCPAVISGFPNVVYDNLCEYCKEV